IAAVGLSKWILRPLPNNPVNALFCVTPDGLTFKVTRSDPPAKSCVASVLHCNELRELTNVANDVGRATASSKTVIPPSADVDTATVCGCPGAGCTSKAKCGPRKESPPTENSTSGSRPDRLKRCTPTAPSSEA